MPIPQFGYNGATSGGALSAAPSAAPGAAPSAAQNNGPSTPSNNVPVSKNVNAVSKNVDVASILKIVAIVVLALLSVTFIGLFIWKNIQYTEAKSDVDSKIAVAVAEAKDEQATKDEQEFAEREKYPYRIFSGPADYGQLTFEYPKTWSLYVAKSAAKGGSYSAFFNPIEVNEDSSVYAIRLEILDEAFDNVTKRYQKPVEENEMSLEVINIANTTANKYTGKIPNTDLSGYIVIFKIRDKTVVLRTDSVLFAEDFNRLISTVTFNA